MTDLPRCSLKDCNNSVSKAGFKLCLEHWRLENNKSKDEKKLEIENFSQSEFLTSTSLGEKLGINGRKVNQVLSELGWIERSKKGWIPTEQGKKLQAESRESRQSGIPFVMWPQAIVTSRILANSVKEVLGARESETEAEQKAKKTQGLEKVEIVTGLRDKLDKFKPTHRAIDGHWVRSKAEALIDNWLYMSSVMHAYERLLPVEEELYCDFYVPAGKVYIEYWGIENDPKYKERKEKKKEIYKKYGFNLIELTDEHIQNLDDYLPKMLLKYNVIVD